VKGTYFFLVFFIVLALIAGLSSLLQNSGEQCLVDGNTIIPITRVEIEVKGGENTSYKISRVFVDVSQPELKYHAPNAPAYRGNNREENSEHLEVDTHKL